MLVQNNNLQYKLCDDISIECFGERSLIFLASRLEVIEINVVTRQVLELLNSNKKLGEVVSIIVKDFKVHEKEVAEDIFRVIDDLCRQGVLKPVVQLKKRMRGEKVDKELIKYIADPGISFREENSDGGILFNVDTNNLYIINTVGVLIWKFLLPYPRTKLEVISHIMEKCENVPDDQIEEDISNFLKNLYIAGFIGEVCDET